MKEKNKIGTVLIISMVILIAIGFIGVSSSSIIDSMKSTNNTNPYYYSYKHLISVFIGFLGFIVGYKLDYHKYKKIWGFLFISAFVLCLIVLTSYVGKNIGNARRWISVGSITFMPSDIMKAASIVLCASYLDNNKKKIIKGKGTILSFYVIIFFSTLLILMQPDLSTSGVIMLTTVIMYFVVGAKLHKIGINLSGLLVIAFIYIKLIKTNYSNSRMDRIKSFLNPLGYAKEGWQLSQSLFAISSGSLFGLGIGKSIRKYRYLSQAYSDFIFAIVTEEMGFVGAFIVISMFFILIRQGAIIAMRAKDVFGTLLAVGITSSLGIQAFINIGVSLGLIPTTGVTLPFLSYGGTSMIVSMGMIGVLLNILNQSGKEEIR